MRIRHQGSPWFCFSTPEKSISRHRLEALEPQRKPISVRLILHAARQVDRAAVQPLQGSEHRPVVLPQQPLGHMQPIVRIDADQMRVERRMMNLRERDACVRVSDRAPRTPPAPSTPCCPSRK